LPEQSLQAPLFFWSYSAPLAWCQTLEVQGRAAIHEVDRHP
jgi:hypothetical protein